MREKATSGWYKWVMLGIVSLTYFLAQGTRQIYSAVSPQIGQDFGLKDLALGSVVSAFTLVFGIVLMFSGLAADFFRRKWMIVLGTFVFSLGILGTGFADGVLMMVITYGLVNALGQAMLPPSNSSLISQFHVETRGTAFAVYQAAIYLGSILCCVSAGYLADLGAGGWRKAFIIFGIVGILWSVVALFGLKDTPNVGSAAEKPSVREAFKAFVSKPSALLLTGALGCYFYLLYGYKQWVPAFLSRAFPELSTTTVAFHAVFWFYLGAVFGVFLGGRVSDRLKALRPAVRFEVEIVAILLSVPFLLLTAWAGSLPLMIAAIFAFGFTTGIYDSNLYAAMLDVINPRYRAVATGIFGCGGCIFGAFGPGVMGWMNDHFTMRTSFASLAIFALVGAALISIAKFRFFEKDKV